MNGVKLTINSDELVVVTPWYSGYPCGYHERTSKMFASLRDAYVFAKTFGGSITLCIPDLDNSNNEEATHRLS